MRLMPICQKPRTSKPAHGQDLSLPAGWHADRTPSQVWCADITYLPMRRGFLYRVAMREIRKRCRFGYRRIDPLLERKGMTISHKTPYRL